MSDLSEFSIFGGKFDKKPEKQSQGSQVSGEPNSHIPSALPVPPAPEIIDIEHLTADQLDALFPSENAERQAAASAAEAPASATPANAAPASAAVPASAPNLPSLADQRNRSRNAARSAAL